MGSPRLVILLTPQVNLRGKVATPSLYGIRTGTVSLCPSYKANPHSRKGRGLHFLMGRVTCLYRKRERRDGRCHWRSHNLINTMEFNNSDCLQLPYIYSSLTHSLVLPVFSSPLGKIVIIVLN
jgi:hypothetical protein